MEPSACLVADGMVLWPSWCTEAKAFVLQHLEIADPMRYTSESFSLTGSIALCVCVCVCV